MIEISEIWCVLVRMQLCAFASCRLRRSKGADSGPPLFKKLLHDEIVPLRLLQTTALHESSHTSRPSVYLNKETVAISSATVRMREWLTGTYRSGHPRHRTRFPLEPGLGRTVYSSPQPSKHSRHRHTTFIHISQSSNRTESSSETGESP